MTGREGPNAGSLSLSALLSVGPGLSSVTCHSASNTMRTILGQLHSDNITHPFILIFSVGVCLQLCLTNGLFHDQSKDSRLSRRRGEEERRFKKKSEFVCSSKAYSQRTRRRYNCDEKIKTSKKYQSAKSGEQRGKSSQPCYDDNK